MTTSPTSRRPPAVDGPDPSAASTHPRGDTGGRVHDPTREAPGDPLGELRQLPTAGRTLSVTVADRLRQLIVTDRLRPGSPLRLVAIADRLGVSVQPVREAVRMLAAEGLVVLEPHRGAFVASLSVEDVEELYAVRAALEGLMARVATERLTDEDVAALRAGFAEMQRAQRADDLPGFIAADRAFHERLYAAAQRPRLLARVIDLWDSSSRARPILFQSWSNLEIAVDDHTPLFRAIMARDAEGARTATQAHLDGAAQRVLAALRADI